MTARLLVIGGGSIGERHVRCALATGEVTVSLCDVREEIRQRLADTYDLSAVYSDLDSALESQPEIAVVATPAHLHIPMTTKLVESGVHTLIEKPLSIGLDGVDPLRELIEKKSMTVGVAYVYRAHPILSEMRDALKSGRFGEPVQMVVVSGQHFPHYRPAYREIYYRDRSTGGGAIQDALTHQINAGEWLVGPITQLTADADHLVLDGVEVEDTVHVLARHGTVMASYSLNQHQAPNESSITIVCTRGTLRFEMHRSRWLWMSEPESEWQTGGQTTLQRDDLFVRQIQLFLESIAQGRDPSCTFDEGLQTLRVNLAILRASEERAWAQI